MRRLFFGRRAGTLAFAYLSASRLCVANVDACMGGGVTLAPVFSKCATGGDLSLRCTFGDGQVSAHR